MQRFTFSEIKQLKHEDVFWSGNNRYVVTSEPVYFNTSDFYGDNLESIEWTAQSTANLREYTFQVSHTKDTKPPKDPMDFKLGDNDD